VPRFWTQTGFKFLENICQVVSGADGLPRSHEGLSYVH
jgi:hypothetical protein